MNTKDNYTIAEVSKLSGLPASTLRYYETIGLIQPVERDASSKQRVYTQQDLDRIDGLACLHATGLSLDDMRAYLENASLGTEGARNDIELLRTQLGKLEAEEQYIELRQQYVKLKIQYWQAVEINDEAVRQEIATKAKKLSQKLKFPKS